MNLNILAIARALVGALQARRVANGLHRLDDRLLADMGISRGEIDSVVRGRTRHRPYL